MNSTIETDAQFDAHFNEMHNVEGNKLITSEKALLSVDDILNYSGEEE